MLRIFRALGAFALATALVSNSALASQPPHEYQTMVEPYLVTHVDEGFVVERCLLPSQCVKMGTLTWKDYWALRSKLQIGIGENDSMSKEDLRRSQLGNVGYGLTVGAVGILGLAFWDAVWMEVVAASPGLYRMIRRAPLGGQAAIMLGVPLVAGAINGFGGGVIYDSFREYRLRLARVEDIDAMMRRLAADIPLGSSATLALPSWVGDVAFGTQPRAAAAP